MTQYARLTQHIGRVGAGILLAGTIGCATALRSHDGASAGSRDLELRIAALTAELLDVSARLDSIAAQGDSARQSVLRMEATLRDRDDQLRALRLELQRLKEIDLKPRSPRRRAQDTTSYRPP